MPDAVGQLGKEAKIGVYERIVPQAKALVENEDYLVSNLANISALLKEAFDFLWVGFYIVDNDWLRLGPFQGPIACTRIQKGKGVCGSSWGKNETLVVGDVHQFPGHIACNSRSNSEIVVPVCKHGKVIAVLDIDDEKFNNFDDVDKLYLEQIVSFL